MSSAITLKQILLAQATATYDVTGRLFALVTDADLLWKPASGDNWMSVGQLLMHCAAFGCGRAVAGFVTGDWVGAEEPGEPRRPGGDAAAAAAEHAPPASALPSVATVAEAVRLLAEDRRLTARCLEGVDAAALLMPASQPPWGGPVLSLFEQIQLMIAHLAQHKGQLFYYLKLMGREVGTADLWGD